MPGLESRLPSRGAVWLLASVAMLFALAQVALGPFGFDYGWDETVYLSQVAAHVPAAAFTAPRARGVTLLVAPIAAITTSREAVRLYLLMIGSVGLFLAFKVWWRVVDAWSVAVAALLFASLWQAQVYGDEVYPNFWIALLCVAAVGWALRIGEGFERPRLWMAGCLAAIALLRPGDAGWLWLVFVVGTHWHEPWRRARVRLVSTIALGVGLLPWLIEAQLRFGGIPQRMAKSSGVEGGLAPHLGFLYEARALYGPLQCRPCTRAYHPLVLDLWWLGIPLLIIAAVLLAPRPQRPTLLLCTGAAVAVALPYLALVGYANPRFLLPAYALAAIPAADGLRRSARFIAARWGGVAAILAVATVPVFTVAQMVATFTITHHSEADRRDSYRLAADAIRRLGVASPCLIAGEDAPPIGFETGCASEGHGLSARESTASVQRALEHHDDVVVIITPNDAPPSWVHEWPATRLQLKGASFAVYTKTDNAP